MISSVWSEHGAHLGTLVGPVLVLAFWAGWADLRAWMRRQGDALAPTVVVVAALLSVGAASAHLLVCPEHFGEDPMYGLFFATAALAQLGWALAVVSRPRADLLILGISGNTGILALWIMTRTLGIPLGAAAGQREAVGPLDLTTAVMEVGLVLCSAWALRVGLDRHHRRAVEEPSRKPVPN